MILVFICVHMLGVFIVLEDLRASSSFRLHFCFSPSDFFSREATKLKLPSPRMERNRKSDRRLNKGILAFTLHLRLESRREPKSQVSVPGECLIGPGVVV